MIQLAPLIFRNVLRNRRRSALTLASTAISLALLALLMALYQGFFLSEATTPSEAQRLIVRHKVSLTQSLPASYQQRIKAVDGVDVLSAWSWFGGVYKEPKNFFAKFAVDPEVIFDVRKDWELPAEQLVAFKKGRTACVVGEELATKFGWKVGERITIKGDIYPVDLELTLVGIYKHPPQSGSMVFHREYLRELLPASSANRDEVGTYAVLAKSPGDVPRVARALR